MVLVDVPVNTGQNFVVLYFKRIPVFEFTRVVIVVVDQMLFNPFQIGFGCAGNSLGCVAFPVGAGSPGNTGSILCFIFGAQEEE